MIAADFRVNPRKIIAATNIAAVRAIRCLMESELTAKIIRKFHA